MTYAQFVARPQELERRIEHKIEDVQLKWSLCSNTVPELKERVQTSTQNTTELSIIRYAEAKDELDRMCEELDYAREELRKFLYANLKEDLADILEWRYIDGKSIKEVAKIRGFSYDTMRNKFSSADRQAESRYNKLHTMTDNSEAI